MKLTQLCSALAKHRVPYAIVGGHAVALHGAPRGTVDFDFIIKWNKRNLQAVEKAMTELGLLSRLPITAEDLFQYKEEYQKNRNLKAWNFYDPKNPLVQVDLIILWDLSTMKSQTLKYKNNSIKILSFEDLIKTKENTGRQQDQEDIKALRRLKI